MGVLGLEEPLCASAQLAQLFAFLLIVGGSVEHEDIDEDALIERLEGVGGTYGSGLAVAQLGMSAVVVVVGVGGLQEVGWCEQPVAEAQQPVVVGPWHADIDIVVPGDEPVVAHRTEERSAVDPAPESFLLAGVEERFKQIDFHAPHFFHLCRDQKAVARLFCQTECVHEC